MNDTPTMYLQIQAAARQFGVSPDLLKKLQRKGKLTRHRIPGTRVNLVAVCELERLIAVPASAPAADVAAS